MRRIIIQGLLACLLALFPVMTIAQTLTKYEYWFDDDFAGRKSGTLSGSYKVLTLGIDTYFMPHGIHKFSFRVRQSDGHYSAVTSSLFLKRMTVESTALEYWFDNNINQRERISISDGSEEQQLTLDLRNNTLYPPGFHVLNIRAMVPGYGMSSLCSVGVLKVTAGAVSSLEYWIDDDRDGVRTIDARTTEGGYIFTSDLELDDVAPGYHNLHMRARSSSGRTASAITTAGFLKLQPGTDTKLEYWFDDNIDQRESISISDGPEEQQLTLDLRNNTLYPPGFHVLHIRAMMPGYGMSALCSVGVLKIAAGAASSLEYWIDDDRAGVRTIDAHTTEGGYIFTSDLDLSNVASGYHNLHMRARSASGRTVSAVSTAGFLKLQAGAANKLEYWIDERSTVHALSGEAIDNGYVFLSNLNLGNLAPGQHRLYLRSRSADGKTASAVTMVPIIVKLDYGPYDDAYSQPVTNAKVTNYSVAVDNQAPRNYSVQNPRYEVSQPHVLDATNLSVGNHTVKLKFWNSANAGVSTESNFKVVIPEPPTLTLTAQQQGGLVKLQFNSVPGEYAYAIRSTDANGALRYMPLIKGSIYPESYTNTDNPPVGTHTYFVKAKYYDWNGDIKYLNSNEVTVTVANAQTEEEAAEQYGNIVGRIVCDKNTPTNGLSVKFNEDGVTVPVQGTNFARTRVAKGTRLTMTVLGDKTHEYESEPLVVQEGDNEVTITGTYKEEFQPDNMVNDLEISQLQLTSEQDHLHVEMYLKNRSLEREWYGRIRVKAIDKNKADDDFANIYNVNYVSPNMYLGISHDVSFEKGKGHYVELDIPITVKKQTEYYFYFESLGRFASTNQGNVTKPIAANSLSAVNTNPIVKPVNPPPTPTQQYTKWNDEAKEAFAYLMLGAASVTPGSEALLGNMDEFAQKVILATGTTSSEAAATAIGLWLEGKDALQAINDECLKLVTEAAREVFKTVSKQAKKQMIKKFWSTIGNVLNKDVSNAKTLVGFIAEAVKASKKSKFEQCMTCMSILYGALASGPASVSNDMKALMVVGQSLIDEAIRILQAQNNWYIITRLVENEVNTSSSDTRTNTAVDFKLIVNDKKKNKPIDFTEKKYHEQIDYITINAMNSPTAEPSVFSFNLKYYEDSIMLETVQNENIRYTGGHLMGYDVAHALYMEIHWANGRITQIPLLNSCDGVDIKTDDVTPMAMPGLDYMKEPPVVYTVTLTTKSGKDNMADEIYLGNNVERE